MRIDPVPRCCRAQTPGGAEATHQHAGPDPGVVALPADSAKVEGARGLAVLLEPCQAAWPSPAGERQTCHHYHNEQQGNLFATKSHTWGCDYKRRAIYRGSEKAIRTRRVALWLWPWLKLLVGVQSNRRIGTE